MKTETSTDHNEQSLANNHHPLHQHAAQWLDAEMDRIWLLGEFCLRTMQDGGLRPKEHPGLADVAAIFATRRDARTAGQEVTQQPASPIDEVRQALKASNQRIGNVAARRRLSNWSRG